MAVMGMRLSQRVNGVSRLHGEVSRQMFAGLWPGFDIAEVPIGSVTNGVHAPTWVAGEVTALAAGGPDSPGGDTDWPAWDRIAAAPPARIWQTRSELRARLVGEIRRRLRASGRPRGKAGPGPTWVGEA